MTLTRIDMVAFDFDGTLADTRTAIIATVQQTLAELSPRQLTPEHITAMMGLPLHQILVEGGVAREAVNDAVLRYREHFPGNIARVALFPGVVACLRELTAAGVAMGIVSSRGRVSLLDLLDRLQIRDLFREVLGDEDVVGKKPAPDFVHKLSASVGVAPARMLVVGDTTYDIEMGKAAGAHTCAVTYGSHDAARLKGAMPSFQLDSLEGLAALLAAGRA